MSQIATFNILSGSTNGKAIKIVATSSTGTTIHTAVSGTSSFDRIFLYATNTSGSPVVLTLEYGTTTAADGNIIQTIQPQSGRKPNPMPEDEAEKIAREIVDDYFDADEHDDQWLIERIADALRKPRSDKGKHHHVAGVLQEDVDEAEN